MRKLRKLAEKQYGVFSSTQARSCKVTAAHLKGMLRSGEIERVVWGVYRVAGSVPSWHQRLMIAVLAAGPGAAISGKAAAALWRFPGYDPGPVEIVQTRRPSRRFHYGHEHTTTFLPDRHVRIVDGIPVTSPERTLFDLCGHATEKRATWLVKTAISRKFTTAPKLAVVLAETGAFGRPGTRMLRLVLAALQDDEPPTESELEDLVLAVLAAAGLDLPSRQIQVGGTTAPIGRIDFLYRVSAIVIEADSKRWHGNWVATENDHRRDALLTAAGFHVIRTNYQQLVEEPELFVNAIRGALARAA